MKDTTDWPMLFGITDDDSDEGAAYVERRKAALIMVADLKAGHKLTAVEVVDDWTDDHAICISARLTVNEKTYEVSDWWLSREGFKMWIKAEDSQKHRDSLYKEHISQQTG